MSERILMEKESWNIKLFFCDENSFFFLPPFCIKQKSFSLKKAMKEHQTENFSLDVDNFMKIEFVLLITSCFNISALHNWNDGLTDWRRQKR